MSKAGTKRPVFWDAIEWVVFNDDLEETSLEKIQGTLTVGLVADMFGRSADLVARYVAAWRQLLNGGEPVNRERILKRAFSMKPTEEN